MRLVCTSKLAMITIVIGGTAVTPWRSSAQVIEPNGVRVPIVPAGTTEKSIQSYFDGLMPPEAIDAVNDAAAEPSTFSPLCGFEAHLVLSESSAQAGLAWYNVPLDPNATPTEIHQVVPETTMTGATISSAAIRGDPSYEGKLIGFALTKGGKAIYYSESARNANCTTCSMPGHWKLMLAYASKREATTYYLAWEDWEGANESGWPDDGDFNDKVFQLTGVRCAGGGEPCDTGKPGACAAGLSECQMGDVPLCKSVAPERPEACDGVDNDCNGLVDDGEPCPPGQVCERGTCIEACGTGEFVCLGGLTCDDRYCVEPACVGVRCDAGKACRAGVCVAPCDGVVCPFGQQCIAGACGDPCDGADCGSERVCRGGVCVEKCTCAGCPQDLVCDEPSGKCVEPGCAQKACAEGSACVAGSCIDRCAGAKCPQAAGCSVGVCQDPASRAMTPTRTGQAGTTGAPVGSGTSVDAGPNTAHARDAGDVSVGRRTGGNGCSCELSRGTRLASARMLWLASLLLYARRRSGFARERTRRARNTIIRP